MFRFYTPENWSKLIKETLEQVVEYVQSYMLKVNNRNIRTRCWRCLKLTPCLSVSIINFKQVNASWYCKDLKFRITSKVIIFLQDLDILDTSSSVKKPDKCYGVCIANPKCRDILQRHATPTGKSIIKLKNIQFLWTHLWLLFPWYTPENTRKNIKDTRANIIYVIQLALFLTLN